MIYIKKVLFIGVVITICLSAFIIFINNKNKLEVLGDEITQNIEDLQKENLKAASELKDGDDEQGEPLDHALFADDPVKDFISEKVNQTIDFFLNKNLHIVAIGDSLTEGIGDETENGGYVGILNNKVNSGKKIAQFENYGKLGNKTNQLLARLDEEEDVKESIIKADIILITIGANDVMQVFKENFTSLTLDKFAEEQIDYENRLRQIFTRMIELNHDVTIYLIGFYNPFQRYFGNIEELNIIADNWNDSGELITNQFQNVHYIPVSDLFEDIDEEYLADDYFHLNYFGYQLMADRILHYLTEEEGEMND